MSGDKISNIPIDWHVCGRAEELFHDPKKARVAMNDDEELAETARSETIRAIIDVASLTFFDILATREAVLDFARRDFDPNARTTMEIRTFAQNNS